MNKKHGGKRDNAGRKGLYDEKTTTITKRVPISKKYEICKEFEKILKNYEVSNQRLMYIIEFEPNVFAAKGKGDPARTLKLQNAVRFDKKAKAEKRLAEIIEEIKHYRKFTNPQVRWVDELSGKTI